MLEVEVLLEQTSCRPQLIALFEYENFIHKIRKNSSFIRFVKKPAIKACCYILRA